MTILHRNYWDERGNLLVVPRAYFSEYSFRVVVGESGVVLVGGGRGSDSLKRGIPEPKEMFSVVR